MRFSPWFLLLGLAGVYVYMNRAKFFNQPAMLTGGGTVSQNPNSTAGGGTGVEVASAAAGIANAINSIFNSVKTNPQTGPATT